MGTCRRPPSGFAAKAASMTSPTNSIAFYEQHKQPNCPNEVHPSTSNPQAHNPASLAAMIQRSDGELEALQAAMGRIEAVLASERTRVAAVRESARRDAKERAVAVAQVQSLAEKVADEKLRRRKLREELASAAEHLKMSLEKNVALAAALATSQQESEESRTDRVLKASELSRAKEKILALQEELHNCREELEKATISCDCKSSMIERLQGQVESSRAHAAAQTAALASAAVAQRRLQCQFVELEKSRDTTATSLAADNEILKQLLEDARDQIDTLRNEAAAEAAEAHDSSVRFSSQRQALCERLEIAQKEAVRSAAKIAELQSQIQILKRECLQAQEEAEASREECSANAAALQRAHQAFEILHARLGAAEIRELEAHKDSRNQRAALAAVGKGFEEMAEHLAAAEERLRKEERRHRGTRAELEAAMNECKVVKNGKSQGGNFSGRARRVVTVLG